MKLKINWTGHFIELVVVIIGITAAFLLNEWREQRAEKELAKKYYNSLLKDLTADADDFDEILSFSQSQDSILNTFITKYKEGTATSEELPTVMSVLVTFNQFSAEKGTFETIKYSGNLDVFSDYELREEINSYYNKVDLIYLQQELHLDYMSNYCFPYIYDNFDILQGSLLPGAKLDYELMNVVVGFQILLKQILNSYEELMEENLSLKLKIAQKLQD